jgi:hypothetical protein
VLDPLRTHSRQRQRPSRIGIRLFLNRRQKLQTCSLLKVLQNLRLNIRSDLAGRNDGAWIPRNWHETQWRFVIGQSSAGLLHHSALFSPCKSCFVDGFLHLERLKRCFVLLGEPFACASCELVHKSARAVISLPSLLLFLEYGSPWGGFRRRLFGIHPLFWVVSTKLGQRKGTDLSGPRGLDLFATTQ